MTFSNIVFSRTLSLSLPHSLSHTHTPILFRIFICVGIAGLTRGTEEETGTEIERTGRKRRRETEAAVVVWGLGRVWGARETDPEIGDSHYHYQTTIRTTTTAITTAAIITATFTTVLWSLPLVTTSSCLRAI